MLQLSIPNGEYFDERTEEFINIDACTLRLEHSLLSISKWESKWCKPFLGKEEKTDEMLRDYIRCMTLNKDVNPMVYSVLSNSDLLRIKEYINAPMTATWFRKDGNRAPSRQIITSELIYYWMIAQNIPIECEKWHLNRLFTLIHICGEKNKDPKKMSKKDRASLMAKRRAASHKKH